MINSTRCAILAKQACATISQVVQKITPPSANNFLKFFFALFATLTLNAATAWAAEYILVTNIGNLSNGDKVIIATKTNNKPSSGVTGGIVQASTSTKKDATVSSTEADWMQFTVTTTSNGWYLSNSSSQFVGKPTENTFYLTTTSNCKGVCSVNANGVLCCNSRYLQKNGNYYRMYSGINNSYTPFYVWKVATSYTVNWTVNPATGGALSATTGNSTTVTPNAAYTYGNPAYTIKTGNASVNQSENTFTATPTANCTIQINMVQKTTAEITFENMGSPAPATTGYYVGDTYTLPSENDFTCGDKTFVGWSTVPIDNSVNKPTTNFYEPGASVTLQADNIFYAVFAETGGTPTTSWPKTDVSDLKDGDEVVIVMNNSSNYAMTNNKGTGTAPDAILAKIKNDCLEDLPVSETIIWVLGKNSSNLTFYKDNTKKAWLYCTDTNNGVRVGTNANKTFTIDSSTGYLKHTGTSRYVGVYNSSDWRCYTSTSTNIGNQTLAFYKKTTTGGYQNYTTECGLATKTHTITFNSDGGSAVESQTIEEGNTATEPTNPNKTGYTFSGWYTEPECTTAFDFATPITSDIILYAKWTAKTYTITLNANGGKFVKDGNESETIEIQYVYGTYANYDQAKLISDYLAEEGIKLSREGYQLNEMWQSNGSAWKRVFTAIDRTITAQWSKLYIVTLSENGTTKELTPQTATSYTLPTELSAGSCQDDTKEFVGWTTTEELSSETTPTSDFYKKGETVTLSEDKTTFYAVFATVDGGGATDNTNVYTSNVSINAGTAITNTSVVIDQEEYNATKAGTGSAKGSVLITIPAGTTYLSFYMAGWKGEGDKTITLTGAEAEPSSFKTIADDGVTGNGNYELVGDVARYAYSTTLNNVTQETQITFSNGGDKQRFVIWGVNASAGATYSNYSTKCVPTCKITYNFDGGEGECTTAVVEKGSEYTLCSTAPTKAGHEFLNWKDQNGGVYAVGATITSVTEDLTLTAQWQVNSYEVTWMSLGDEVLVNKADYNTQPTKPATDPTYTCSIGTKEFVGWSTQEIDDAGVPANLYTDEFPVVTEAITYHAVFAGRSAEATTTVSTLLVTEKLGNYASGSMKDDQENVWKYYAGGLQDGETYYIALRNNNNGEISYIESPKFSGTVQSIVAHVKNGSNSKVRTVYLRSSAIEKPAEGDLGATSIPASNNSEVNLDFTSSFDKFYIQVSEGLQFHKIVVTSGIAIGDYTDYTTSCPVLELTEGENTLTDGVTADVKVNRSFTTGNLYTISLPFTLENVSSVFGNQAYEYTSLAKDGNDVVLYFNKVNTIEAGKPYLIEPTKDVLGFSVDNVTLSNATNNISFRVGTTTVDMEAVLSAGESDMTNGKYWLASDRYLYNNETRLLGLRAVFNINSASGIAPRARVAFRENTTTGLSNITNDENTTIKVIENGQLIIIRNGEKFNAQGIKF